MLVVDGLHTDMGLCGCSSLRCSPEELLSRVNSLVSEAASDARPHPTFTDGANFSVLIAFLGSHFQQGSENG